MTAGHGQLVVLGMHRSGTSGVTGLLERAGAWFGPAGIATEANAENPKGFYERRDVRAVCDELLRGAGADWWNVAGFSVDAVPESVAERARVSWRRIVAELDQHEPWAAVLARASLRQFQQNDSENHDKFVARHCGVMGCVAFASSWHGACV